MLKHNKKKKKKSARQTTHFKIHAYKVLHKNGAVSYISLALVCATLSFIYQVKPYAIYMIIAAIFFSTMVIIHFFKGLSAQMDYSDGILSNKEYEKSYAKEKRQGYSMLSSILATVFLICFVPQLGVLLYQDYGIQFFPSAHDHDYWQFLSFSIWAGLKSILFDLIESLADADMIAHMSDMKPDHYAKILIFVYRLSLNIIVFQAVLVVYKYHQWMIRRIKSWRNIPSDKIDSHALRMFIKRLDAKSEKLFSDIIREKELPFLIRLIKQSSLLEKIVVNVLPQYMVIETSHRKKVQAIYESIKRKRS